MKKLLFLFVTLTAFASISYASFPITENNTELTTINFEDDEEEPSLLVYILRGILFFSIVGFGLYYVIRAWVKEFRKRKWVRSATITIFSVLLLFITLALSIDYGYGGG